VVGVNVSRPDRDQASASRRWAGASSTCAPTWPTSAASPAWWRRPRPDRRVDILVNNAGIIRREDAIKFSEKDWDDVIDLNLKSVFFLSQAVARQFMAQGSGGKIINVASMLSFQGGIRVPSYTASKSGVVGITRLMANEWAQHGINVNAIAPGYMATNNTARCAPTSRATPPSSSASRPAAGAARGPGRAGGVPGLGASDYVNGYTVAVDGGWLARC
jgi:2-deoxy-D-gluconate 3-dehydrogenase